MTNSPVLSPRATAASAGAFSIWPGLGVCILLAGVAVGAQKLVPPLSPLLVSIVLGVVVANTYGVHERVAPGVKVSSKRLLRLGIVLLGLQLSLRDVADLGWGATLLVVAVVALGILGTLAAGHLLGVPGTQRLLIACGFSICGAAAVAAVAGTLEADDEDVATAIGLVVLYGSLMIAALPPLLGVLPLTVQQGGIVVGGSIHEVAQVVAAGGLVSSSVLTVAVIVKLARVVMLAPVILAVGVVRSRGGGHVERRPPLVPLFVIGFLGAILLNTFVSVPPAVAGIGALAQTVLLSAAMFALGTGLKASLLRQVGRGPVVLGAVSSGIVFAVALTGGLVVA